ncbi:MAG: glycosyltransferase family 39 protein [bacterium]|nr:glycosyltransferase family 39 protein [bacterium]
MKRTAFLAGLALLILAAAFVLFYRLGERGFENRDTIWYVVIAWEMLRSGDWIVPRFNCVIFTEKPILFIWLVALLARAAGALTPFVSRLPSALAALGCVLLTVRLGRRLFGTRAALLAGLALCTSYAFAWEARVCMVDMLFTLFVTASLLLVWEGLRADPPRGGALLAGYAAVGLAALTKGPLGVIFPALAVLAHLAWTRRLGAVRRMRLPWGILIVVAMQAAWYVPFLLRIGPEGRRFFVDMYVYKENLLRFTTGFDKPEPFWFYLPAFLSHFLPWSVFLVLWPFAPGPRRDARFPWAWLLSILLFLTISTGKHSRYALPVYPAAALLVGDFWDRLMAAEGGRLRCVVAGLVACAAAAAAAGYPVFVRNVAPGMFGPAVVAAAALLLALAALSVRRPLGTHLQASFAVVVLAFLLMWSAYIAGLPAHDARRAEHERLALDVAPAVGGAPLALYGPTDERFGRRLGLGLFLGRPVAFFDREEDLLAFLRSDRRAFCLMERAVYDEAAERLGPSVVPVAPHRYRRFDLILVAAGPADVPAVSP